MSNEEANDRREADVFALWNEADEAKVEPQARGMVFNEDDWLNPELRPEGVPFLAQVEKVTVSTTKNGATEYRVRVKDITGEEADGRMMNIKSYLSNKVDPDTGQPTEGTIKFNRRTQEDLLVLGLTRDFMKTRPSMEAQGELLSQKGAKVMVTPFWEFDSNGKPWPKLDSYWEAVADETQTDLDDVELDEDEEF